jgi:Flp pilus assembly protein TadB
MGPLPVLAALLSAVAVAGLAAAVVPPTRRLGPRVRPYAIGARTALGGSADVGAVAGGGAFQRALGPMLRAASTSLSRVIDRDGDAVLGRRIRQAGLFPDLGEDDRLAAYRARQFLSLVTWLAAGIVYTVVFGLEVRRGLVVVGLVLVVGATRQRGRLGRAIEDRRTRMRIEIYTVNQLLAVRARAGGGVIQAVTQMADRARGEVVGELREALRMHRAGVRASEAFSRIAESTPEPFCARTYSLLAVAEERGVDLAEGLLALSEDVREARREALRRSATKRRAAMLIPTIAILAPVMLVFVGAPLPQLVLGWR